VIETVGIIGAGAWGRALAFVAASAGRRTRVWARRQASLDLLPDNPLIEACSEVAPAAEADAVLLVVSAQAVRAVVRQAAGHLGGGRPLVICAKGIERATGKRLSEVIAEEAPEATVAVLSGPSFAADVLNGLPTAVTIAAADADLALALSAALGGATFRPYAETDVIGVELGGAVKNVLAIAAGIVAGRGLGASAQAALVARGFAEMRRFAEASGARAETLMGLSGLGDLVLTSSGPQSRNFAYGLKVGRGGPVVQEGALVEGVATAAITAELAGRQGIEMPITVAVAAILDGRLGVDAAVEQLMARPLKLETG